ncbi:MAG: AAA family ATPase [Thermococcus sp.]|uniref:adenylate kinase family protein n=1 Tax=Thermococcus sp. TaxID=35749 RepID=UPI000F16FB0E|nr:adenylate kinase family protein [Thermococcus sp.]MCD6140444.1 AAA family ATPase [Thermococcus sp.]MCD6144096.1 AAA family ATPase [Thermococcus sp.]RLF82692.1 MAG: kinase [Thermococci archaeon]
MLIAVSGTPGVGKTTVAKLLAEKMGYDYVDLREFALKHGIGKIRGDELEIEVDKLAYYVKEKLNNRNAVLDGHLSHLMPVDQIIILRAHPKLIGERLKGRGYRKEKISENVEAELVDVCLLEALDENETIIEVDTTGKKPEEVVNEVLSLLERGIKRRVGIVDWSKVYDDVIPYLNLGGDDEWV